MAFIHLDGCFVTFMSGNSTRAAVDLAQGRFPQWLLAVGLVGSFVVGVMIGTVAGRVPEVRRQTAVLSTSVAQLLLSALSSLLLRGISRAAPLMAAAIGAMKVTYTRAGEVSAGLTCMTGTLVKLGWRPTEALNGGSRTMWIAYAVLKSILTPRTLAG